MLLRTGKLKPYRKLKPKMDNLSENEENKGKENESTEVLDLAIILKAIKNAETNTNQKLDEVNNKIEESNKLLRNEMLGIIDTNTSNQNKKIKDLECRTQNYVYSRVVPLENKIADCDKSIGEIHSDVSVLGRTVGLIESDVKEMAREMQNLEVKCSKVKLIICKETSSFNMVFKYFLCVLFAITACNAMQFNYPGSNVNQPRVLINKVANMSPSQQADAADFLKEVLIEKGNTHSQSEICEGFRERYAQKYQDNIWHVVVFKAYSVMSVKSIELKVDNDAYLLFATKKH
ncbi:hypothetical protein RN001_012923 [Aquatica leii]|uniref:Uncharacterized protein n=1 Tax=Aquatica leii TaxID=1421715 RepID=A0AAN7P208_9COLE|nr:hypothetical protein RN001_012923 [Aquatica leii]